MAPKPSAVNSRADNGSPPSDKPFAEVTIFAKASITACTSTCESVSAAAFTAINELTADI